VPHCAVIPLPLSHTTALSRTPSIAGRSSAPPFLMEIFMPQRLTAATLAS